MRHYVGLDLGSRRDYTAFVVLGVEERADPPGTVYAPGAKPNREPPRYHVRHIERVPLGTPYPQVVERVRDFMRLPELAHSEWHTNATYSGYSSSGPEVREIPPHLLIDATGVGVAVTDMFKAAGQKFTAITITGGDTATGTYGSYRVPARDLVAATQVLLDTDRLLLPPGIPMGDVLERELLSFRVKINPDTAHDSYAAWREGEHDDLVYALCLPCWYAEKMHGPARPVAYNFKAKIGGGMRYI